MNTFLELAEKFEQLADIYREMSKETDEEKLEELAAKSILHSLKIKNLYKQLDEEWI